MELDRKLKLGLDEYRLLILGTQVLFGFAFEAALQDEFSKLSPTGHAMHFVSLSCLLIAMTLLIAPSMFHQLSFAGESRVGAVRVATACAGASLLPFTAGLAPGAVGSRTVRNTSNDSGRRPPLSLWRRG